MKFFGDFDLGEAARRTRCVSRSRRTRLSRHPPGSASDRLARRVRSGIDRSGSPEFSVRWPSLSPARLCWREQRRCRAGSGVLIQIKPPVGSRSLARDRARLSLLAPQQRYQEQCHGNAERQCRDLHCHICAHRGSNAKGGQDHREYIGSPEAMPVNASCKRDEKAFNRLTKIGGRHHGTVGPRFRPGESSPPASRQQRRCRAFPRHRGAGCAGWRQE